jgi:hypothetical protein
MKGLVGQTKVKIYPPDPACCQSVTSRAVVAAIIGRAREGGKPVFGPELTRINRVDIAAGGGYGCSWHCPQRPLSKRVRGEGEAWNELLGTLVDSGQRGKKPAQQTTIYQHRRCMLLFYLSSLDATNWVRKGK